MYDDFYSKNYLKLIHPRSIKSAGDSFKKVVFSQNFLNENLYVKSYAHYLFAALDEASGMREKYFQNN